MRRFCTWIALAAFTAVSAWALVGVIRAERSAGPPFTREELAAWLNQSHEPSDSAAATVLRRRAARQLDQDFHAGYDWQPAFEVLPAEQQDTFAANFRSLLVLLVEQRADAYFALPKQHRELFLDGQVNDLATWYVVGKGGKSSGILLIQQGLLAMNSGELSGPGRKKARDFVSAFQARYLVRLLNR